MAGSTAAESLLPESGSLPSWLLTPFIIISVIESLLGTIGNILVIVIIVFLAKPNVLQTSHNCFIVNLALSDFVLCLFTMPLNTYRTLKVYMTFPPAFCKLADSFPAINIYVSSLTIVAISIYRYLVVCYPYKKFIGPCSTVIIMISIWVLAIGAASPLFIYSRSIPAFDENLIDTMVEETCNHSLTSPCAMETSKFFKRFHVCHESWPQHGNLHLLYTIFMLFLQFILPILIICVTYYQVMVKLRERFRYRFLMKRHNIGSLRHEVRRQRRNNVLLLLIVTVYAISWLPFNISYILLTYGHRFQFSGTTQSKPPELVKYLPLRFLVCMISAVANPFLYSYFNETFRDGLQRIFSVWCPHSNERLRRKSSDQSDYAGNKHQLKKYGFSSNFLSGNVNYSRSTSQTSHDPSTRLTVVSATHFFGSNSSHI